jgi:hypothetical protein
MIWLAMSKNHIEIICTDMNMEEITHGYMANAGSLRGGDVSGLMRLSGPRGKTNPFFEAPGKAYPKSQKLALAVGEILMTPKGAVACTDKHLRYSIRAGPNSSFPDFIDDKTRLVYYPQF